MADLAGVENSKPIEIGDEIVDMLSENIEKAWYMLTVSEEGVYRMEYSKETIETIEVFEKPRFFFQKSRLIDKTRDLCDKKWIELFYLEKGKTYFINLILKPYLKYGTYTFKILEHEVPANNFMETAKLIDLNNTVEAKIDYVTDKDWYKFGVLENSCYKVTYSRVITDAIHFYEEDNKKPEGSISEKLYLVNDTVCEVYQFEGGKNYYMQVEHQANRGLGKYQVRFTKIKDEDAAVRKFF